MKKNGQSRCSFGWLVGWLELDILRCIWIHILYRKNSTRERRESITINRCCCWCCYERWNENKAIINRINDLFPSNKSIWYLLFFWILQFIFFEIMCVFLFYFVRTALNTQIPKTQQQQLKLTASQFIFTMNKLKRNETKRDKKTNLHTWRPTSQSIGRPSR